MEHEDEWDADDSLNGDGKPNVDSDGKSISESDNE